MAAPPYSISGPLALLLSLSAACAVAQPKKEIARKNMSNLTSKVEQFVPDPAAVMGRAKVMGSRWKPNNDGTESGFVTLKVLDLFRGSAPEIFEIEGTRNADPVWRPLDRLNQWNALQFILNDELLLALHTTANPRVFTALAAVRSVVKGVDLKEALAIEALAVTQRLARLRLAVQSDSQLLQKYAFAALRVAGVATREQGALALAHALEATTHTDARLALFAEMETPPYADMSKGPDASNRAILSSWLKAILHETNEERRSSFLNHFAAQVGNDRALAGKFAAAIQDPPRAQVAALLQSDPRYKVLADAWAH